MKRLRIIKNISIVIPTFNRQNDLEKAIISILKQDYRNFEIIVIDNGPSTDDTKAIVEKFSKSDKRINYISTNLKGCIFARNIGAHKAKGDIYLTVDDDIELIKNNTLKKLHNTFKSNNKIGIVGSIELRDPNQKLSKGPQVLPQNIGRISKNGNFYKAYNKLEGHGITEVDHVRSAFMGTRMDLLKKANYFDEVYNASGMGFRYESDLCMKIKNLGYKVVVNPEIKIWHKASKRSRGFKRKHDVKYFYFSNRNHIYFMKKHFWEKKSLIYFLVDIINGTRTCPGLIKGLCRMIEERDVAYLIYTIYALRGKVAGYLKK